jgi:molecular chaperone GrpE
VTTPEEPEETADVDDGLVDGLPEAAAAEEASPTEAGFAPAQGAAAESALHAELDAARAALAEANDRLKREQAQFVNDRRRIERLAEDRARFAISAVVTDLLPVVDAIHSAIEGLGEGEREGAVATGLAMVERQLLDALRRHGIERMEALDRPFDPTHHEAVLEREEARHPERTVVQVVRPGFTLHGRVVRPAHVVVSRGARAQGERDGAR